MNEEVDDKGGEEDKVYDDSKENLIFLQAKEGANLSYPATPLGRKVVTEGHEDSPYKGEDWRQVTRRRIQQSGASASHDERIHSLATSFNSWYSSNKSLLHSLIWMRPKLEIIGECFKNLNATEREVDKVMELGYLNEEFKEWLKGFKQFKGPNYRTFLMF